MARRHVQAGKGTAGHVAPTARARGSRRECGEEAAGGGRVLCGRQDPDHTLGVLEGRGGGTDQGPGDGGACRG